MTRVLLLSRAGQWGLVAAVGMWVVAVAIGRAALEIDLSPIFPPTKLVVVEVCVIVAATLLAILTRSRFWEWDRVARGGRARFLAGVISAVAIGLSVMCVLAIVPWLPAGATWGWVLANAFVLAATVLLVAALSSPLLAGGITLMLWFGSAITANLASKVWLPLAYYRGQEPSWEVAAGLVVLAVGIHAWTCGMTGWAHRQFER